MAHAAEFAFDDACHRDIVTARPHFKPEFVVADLAAKPDAVKPVWKYHWTHAFGLGVFVQDHIAILGVSAERKT